MVFVYYSWHPRLWGKDYFYLDFRHEKNKSLKSNLSSVIELKSDRLSIGNQPIWQEVQILTCSTFLIQAFTHNFNIRKILKIPEGFFFFLGGGNSFVGQTLIWPKAYLLSLHPTLHLVTSHCSSVVTCSKKSSWIFPFLVIHLTSGFPENLVLAFTKVML